MRKTFGPAMKAKVALAALKVLPGTQTPPLVGI
jgi:hypothetical protein